MVTLPKFQGAVLQYFSSQEVPLVEDVTLFRLRFSQAPSDVYYAAQAELKGEPEQYVVFTLGTFSDWVFMMVTKTKPVESIRALGNLDDYQRKNGNLSFGDTAQLSDAVFASNPSVGMR